MAAPGATFNKHEADTVGLPHTGNGIEHWQCCLAILEIPIITSSTSSAHNRWKCHCKSHTDAVKLDWWCHSRQLLTRPAVFVCFALISEAHVICNVSIVSIKCRRRIVPTLMYLSALYLGDCWCGIVVSVSQVLVTKIVTIILLLFTKECRWGLRCPGLWSNNYQWPIISDCTIVSLIDSLVEGTLLRSCIMNRVSGCILILIFSTSIFLLLVGNIFLSKEALFSLYGFGKSFPEKWQDG